MQATDTFRCFICGKLECKGGNKCPKKGIDKSKWAAHIAMKKNGPDESESSYKYKTNLSLMTKWVLLLNLPLPQPVMVVQHGCISNAFATQCQQSTKPEGMLKVTNLLTMSGNMFKTHMLLDNQTSDHLIVNQAFVGKVERVPQGINMHTNMVI